MRSAGGRPALVLPAILMVLGFLVAAAVAEERVRERAFPGQAAELLGLIEARHTAIAELAEEARRLSARLERVRERAATGSASLRQTLDRIDALRLDAGLAPVEGPGVVVEVRDSEDAPTTRGEVTDLRIHDVDLQLIVNALWRAGAGAVAVNGRRVVSTTAIREAGGTILVNFSPVTSPYRVTAIGDPERLQATLEESEIGRQFDLWRQVYGLGFSVRPADVILPGLAADAELRWATPAGTGP